MDMAGAILDVALADIMEVSDEALIAAMMENPILIERPIVVRGKKAALGRPPENVLKLLYLVRP